MDKKLRETTNLCVEIINSKPHVNVMLYNLSNESRPRTPKLGLEYLVLTRSRCACASLTKGDVKYGWILTWFIFSCFMERHEDGLFKNVRNNEANTKLFGPNRLSLISQYRIYHIAQKKVSLTKPTRENLAGSGSQSDHRIRFIMPAGGFRHI